MPDPYVAHTMREWFEFLSGPDVARAGLVDEVNFWSPSADRSMKAFVPGEPVFFRLGAAGPRDRFGRCIVGYAFFAAFERVSASLAWELFGVRNGAPTRSAFYALIGRTTPAAIAAPLACTILRGARFWPDSRFLSWGEERGWAATGVQRGRSERDPRNAAALWAALASDAAQPPEELAPAPFSPLIADERRVALSAAAVREGQGTFRLRLLRAYDGCAITGEHTEPVLQAAHIQPYLGPRSNHVQNGLLLTQEWHTLFDRGLVTIDPPTRAAPARYAIRVSNLLRERWQNGRRYREMDGQPLRLPANPEAYPSREALDWHREHVFERVA
jgi:putative restriction endonuclease